MSSKININLDENKNSDDDSKSRDAISLYNVNHDTVLTMGEMSKLAAQLATQVDYNNKLLIQISALESNQLVLKKDNQEKANAMIKTVKIADEVSTENKILKDKFGAVDKKISTIEASLRESQLDASIKARQSKEYADELDASRNETKQLQSKVTQFNLELFSTSKADKALTADYKIQLIGIQTAHNALTKDYEIKCESLETSKEAISVEKEKYAELLQKYDEQQSRISNIVASKAAAESRVANIEDMLVDVKAKERNSSSEATSAIKNSIRVGERLQSSLAVASAKDTEINSLKCTLDESKTKVTNSLALVSKTQGKLDELRKSSSIQIEEKSVDLKFASEEIKLLKDRISDMEERARETEDNHVYELERLTGHFAASRKTSEESYNKLKHDYDVLNNLLHSSKKETSFHRMEAAETIAKISSENSAVKRELQSAGRANDETNNEALKQAESLKKELESVQNELESRTQRHIHVLAALQTSVQVLSAESNASRDNTYSIREDLKELKIVISESNTSNETLEWGNKVKDMIEMLLFENKRLMHEKKILVDKLRIVENKSEAYVMENNHLQKKVTTLTNDLTECQSQLISQQKNFETKYRGVSSKLEAEKELKNSVEEELKDKIWKLKNSLDTIEDLEKNCLELTFQTDKITENSKSSLLQLEDKLSAVREELNTLKNVKGYTTKEKEELEGKLNESTRTLTMYQSNTKNLENKLKIKNDENQLKCAALNNHIKGLNDAMKKFQTQLRETHNLLRILHEQREMLETDNSYLRSELNDVYSKVLNDIDQQKGNAIDVVDIATDGVVRDLKM